MNVKNQFVELRDKVVALLNRSAKVMENVVPHLGDENASSLPQTFQERANTVQNEEFVVVVVGEMNRGKSMLLNAMMHKQLLTMDVLECTATVNFLRYPKENQSSDHVEVHFTNGKPSEKVPVDQLKDYTSRLSDLGSDEVANLVDHVDAFVESRFLKENVLLVDTPGTNTTTHNHIRITNDQIDRSNAAIFLFSATAQMTKSDRKFLEGVEEAVAHLFFVVNKIDSIDESEVSRVLDRVENNIREVVDQSKGHRVFGVSGAKALLGRTGYVKSPILAENERSKLADPQFCETLIKESGIDAFEEDLERYLFGGGKGYDLLHSPLSFIQSETAKLIEKLHRQIEVLDDKFDLSGLELEVEKMERIVGDRKREIEGMTDELAEELRQALLEARKDFEEKCKSAEAALKDALNAYDSHETLKDNWIENDQLADLPGRHFAALERQAEKFLNEAVGGVLRKQTREIRTQIRGELGEIAMELPEMPEMVLQLQEPKIDKVKAEEIKKLEKEREDCYRQLEQLEHAQIGFEEREYAELQAKRQQLDEDHFRELQIHGSRPTVVTDEETKTKREWRSGLLGWVLTPFIGKKTIEYTVKVEDNRDRQDYDKRLKSIKSEHSKTAAELDDLLEKAKGKVKSEVLAKLKADKLAESNRNLEQELERAESEYRENVAKADQRALALGKGQLLSTFQRAAETLTAAVEHSADQTERMATDFIENAMAELDATLKDHNQELKTLESLRDAKESERDTLNEGIKKALSELGGLKEDASRLEKDHEAFREEMKK